MLVNFDTKEVFIHIPKTGGTTVTYSLKNWKTVYGVSNTHTSIEQFKEKVVDSEKYKFYTFVRNPYIRFNSMYKYLLLRGDIHDTPLTFATNIFLGKYDWVFTNSMCYFCRKPQLAEFGRLETFNEDFKRIFKSEPISIKIKETKYKDIYEEYPQLRDMVARLYYEDFVEFGYDIQSFIYKSISVTWTLEDLNKICNTYLIEENRIGSVHDKISLFFIEDK
jgi:hypothetical protein